MEGTVRTTDAIALLADAPSTNIDALLASSKHVRYLSIACSRAFIAIGASTGAVHVFPADKGGHRRRFISTDLGGISKVRFSPDGTRVCALTAQGYVVAWDLKLGVGAQKEQLLVCLSARDLWPNTPEPSSLVTCIEWDAFSKLVLCGDSVGRVFAIGSQLLRGAAKQGVPTTLSPSEANPSRADVTLLYAAESAIVQIAPCGHTIAVSSMQRCVVVDVSTRTSAQVGKAKRKAPGAYGVCWEAHANSDAAQRRNSAAVQGLDALCLYTGRQGYRIWRASAEGDVQATVIFEDDLTGPHVTGLARVGTDGALVVEKRLTTEGDVTADEEVPQNFAQLGALDGGLLLAWGAHRGWLCFLNPAVAEATKWQPFDGESVVDVCTAGERVHALVEAVGTSGRPVYRLRSFSAVSPRRAMSSLADGAHWRAVIDIALPYVDAADVEAVDASSFVAAVDAFEAQGLLDSSFAARLGPARDQLRSTLHAAPLESSAVMTEPADTHLVDGIVNASEVSTTASEAESDDRVHVIDTAGRPDDVPSVLSFSRADSPAMEAATADILEFDVTETPNVTKHADVPASMIPEDSHTAHVTTETTDGNDHRLDALVAGEVDESRDGPKRTLHAPESDHTSTPATVPALSLVETPAAVTEPATPAVTEPASLVEVTVPVATPAAVTAPVATTAAVTEPATPAAVTKPATPAAVTEPATPAEVTEPATPAAMTAPVATPAAGTEPTSPAAVTAPVATPAAVTEPATLATVTEPGTSAAVTAPVAIPAAVTEPATSVEVTAQTIPAAVTVPVATSAAVTAPVATPAAVTAPVATPAAVTALVATPAAVKAPVAAPAVVTRPAIPAASIATPAAVTVPVATSAAVTSPVATPAAVKAPVATPAALTVATPAAVTAPVATPAAVTALVATPAAVKAPVATPAALTVATPAAVTAPVATPAAVTARVATPAAVTAPAATPAAMTAPAATTAAVTAPVATAAVTASLATPASVTASVVTLASVTKPATPAEVTAPATTPAATTAPAVTPTAVTTAIATQALSPPSVWTEVSPSAQSGSDYGVSGPPVLSAPTEVAAIPRSVTLNPGIVAASLLRTDVDKLPTAVDVPPFVAHASLLGAVDSSSHAHLAVPQATALASLADPPISRDDAKVTKTRKVKKSDDPKKKGTKKKRPARVADILPAPESPSAAPPQQSQPTLPPTGYNPIPLPDAPSRAQNTDIAPSVASKGRADNKGSASVTAEPPRRDSSAPRPAVLNQHTAQSALHASAQGDMQGDMSATKRDSPGVSTRTDTPAHASTPPPAVKTGAVVAAPPSPVMPTVVATIAPQRTSALPKQRSAETPPLASSPYSESPPRFLPSLSGIFARSSPQQDAGTPPAHAASPPGPRVHTPPSVAATQGSASMPPRSASQKSLMQSSSKGDMRTSTSTTNGYHSPQPSDASSGMRSASGVSLTADVSGHTSAVVSSLEKKSAASHRAVVQSRLTCGQPADMYRLLREWLVSTETECVSLRNDGVPFGALVGRKDTRMSCAVALACINAAAALFADGADRTESASSNMHEDDWDDAALSLLARLGCLCDRVRCAWMAVEHKSAKVAAHIGSVEAADGIARAIRSAKESNSDPEALVRTLVDGYPRIPPPCAEHALAEDTLKMSYYRTLFSRPADGARPDARSFPFLVMRYIELAICSERPARGELFSSEDDDGRHPHPLRGSHHVPFVGDGVVCSVMHDRSGNWVLDAGLLWKVFVARGYWRGAVWAATRLGRPADALALIVALCAPELIDASLAAVMTPADWAVVVEACIHVDSAGNTPTTPTPTPLQAITRAYATYAGCEGVESLTAHLTTTPDGLPTAFYEALVAVRASEIKRADITEQLSHTLRRPSALFLADDAAMGRGDM